MLESAAKAGMATAVEAEKVLAAVVELQARVSSETDESFATINTPDGVVLSGSEKRRRMGAVRRTLVCYLRKMSPAQMLKKMRDCYVTTLGSCAQNYVSGYTPRYGVSFASCHASPRPPGLSMSMHDRQDLYGSEFCLSPAFRKSFNESLLELKGSGAFLDSDRGATPFRKSFSDFESSVSTKMRRTYSDAAALYSSPRLCAGRSPGWAPNRMLGGHALMIFPIQEAPELILASFRKEAQELRMASFRKESVEPGLSHVRDGDLPALTEEGTLALSKFQVKENLDASQASTEVPKAVELQI